MPKAWLGAFGGFYSYKSGILKLYTCGILKLHVGSESYKWDFKVTSGILKLVSRCFIVGLRSFTSHASLAHRALGKAQEICGLPTCHGRMMFGVGADFG